MKVPSPAVLKAVAAIDLVPSRAGIPSAEFIRLSANKGSVSFALSSEIFGVTKAPGDGNEEWTAYVDRASFTPFINASKETNSKAPFDFRWSDKTKQLTIRCGRRKGMFNEVQNVGGYSVAKKKTEGVKLILSKEEKAALSLAAKYATPDPTIEKLNCVYIDRKGWVLASNDKAAIRVRDPRVKASMPLPLGILPTLQSESVESILVTDRMAKINLDCGYLCQLVKQRAAKNFPLKALHKNFELAKDYPTWFKVQASKLTPALTRLMNYTAMVIRRDAIVKVSGEEGEDKVTLQCEVPQGKFEERVQIRKPLKKSFNMDWLLYLVTPLAEAAMDGDITIQFKPDATSYYVHGKSFDLLVSRFGKVK